MSTVYIFILCVIVLIVCNHKENKKSDKQKKYQVPINNGKNQKEVYEAMLKQSKYFEDETFKRSHNIKYLY